MSDNPEALRTALQRIVDWDESGLALTADHIAQARAALAQQAATPTPGPYSSDDEAVVCLMGLAAAYAVAYGGMNPNGNVEATQRAAESLSTAIRSVLAAARQAATPAPAEPTTPKAARYQWDVANLPARLERIKATYGIAAPPATPAAQPADEREAFEAWAMSRKGSDRLSIARHIGPSYVYSDTDAAWGAWQARAALEG